jgi:hypothetical protein
MKTPEQRRIYRAVLERHGKYLLLFIISIIVLFETRSLLGTISGRKSGLQLIAALAFSLVQIRSAIATWFGDQDSRGTSALFLLLRTAPSAILLVVLLPVVGPQLVSPDNTKIFLLSCLMLSPALIPIVFYGGLAVLMKFSPSVDAFTKSVLRNGVAPRRWPEWLRTLVGVPSISERIEFSMQRSENPVYTRLTPELLSIMEDDELDNAVLNYINDRRDQAENQSTAEILLSLPVGYQGYYSLWCMQAEIDNGGFFQFFVNKGHELAFMALEASRRINRPDVAALLIDAINAYLKDETNIQQIQSNLQSIPLSSDWAENYVAADRDSMELSDLTRKYYELPGIDLHSYLRNNLDQFRP